MYKVINHSIEILLDPENNTPYEVESYTLSSRRKVVWDYKSQSWRDKAGNEYTAVSMGKIVGFNRKNTLKEAEKELLRQSPEGKAYVEYNERIGGDRLGLEVPWGYPPSVQNYLDEGHTVTEIYEECIEAGISWEERFSCYVESDPSVCDSYVVEVLWD